MPSDSTKGARPYYACLKHGGWTRTDGTPARWTHPSLTDGHINEVSPTQWTLVYQGEVQYNSHVQPFHRPEHILNRLPELIQEHRDAMHRRYQQEAAWAKRALDEWRKHQQNAAELPCALGLDIKNA